MEGGRELLRSYDILERIGAGSGGVIYKAYHRRLRKTVVLKKIIDPNQSIDSKRREVDILKDINHSYLPQILDFLETDEGTFTVMNYIPGRSFQQLLNERVVFAKEDILRWALQLCSALNYLHTREIPIIHGDIKPSNIMLKPDGDICLIDFNIAFYFNENTVLGCTRGYTPPEQFWAVSSKRKRDNDTFVIDNRSDIYSVGATLYHMATGNARADFTHEIDVNRLASTVGERFAHVIEKATSLDPQRRYQSAYEMYQALLKVPEESAAALKTERRSRRKVAGIIIAAVLAVGGITGGVFAYNKHQVDLYDENIDKAKAAIMEGDMEAAGEYSEKAIDIMDDKAEGYYWKDYILYSQGRYQDCVMETSDDIEKVHEKAEGISEARSIADLYCLKGTSQLAADDIEGSVNTFDEAASMYGKLMTAENYRDYAVALAKDQRFDEAEARLAEAEKLSRPLTEYSLSYTRGEIQAGAGKDDQALDSFRSTADSLREKDNRSSDDEYLLNRTYMSMYQIYRDRDDTDDCIRIMLEAEEETDSSWSAQINRNLGKAYTIRKDYPKAAERYRKVAESESATPTDWFNLANACIACMDAASAGYATENYGKSLGSTEMDFNYWFLKARTEEVIQSRAPAGRANYDDFNRYYYRAKECADRDQSNHHEAEMDLLDATFTIVN